MRIFKTSPVLTASQFRAVDFLQKITITSSINKPPTSAPTGKGSGARAAGNENRAEKSNRFAHIA
jgi:hypothetical protein